MARLAGLPTSFDTFRASRLNRRVVRRNLNGWLFISPWLIGFLGLSLYPALMSLYYSLTDYNLIQTPNWVGFGNYISLLTTDPLFWISVKNTLFYVVLYVPLSIVLGVGAAMLLNIKTPGIGIYRAIVYLPSVIPEVVTGVLWFWMLNPQFGFANTLLKALGLPALTWLNDANLSKPSLVLIALWGLGSHMVIYLAALQEIPEHLYEAASIDGAGVLAKTRFITLPLLTPTIFFNLVLGVIAAFQSFTGVYVVTRGTGSPLDSTLFYSLLIYRNAFTYLKMGYASAMAWLLFLAVLVVTFIVFRTSGRWVFYGGENSDV